MGLRFIYGRAGTGKSQFYFDEIRERLDKENIEKQVVENKNLDVQNKNNAEEKLNISDLSEEKLDIYIDYIKEILGMNESENEIQRER